MNKWLKELEKLTNDENIISYYKGIIEETGIDNYDQIVDEFGLPEIVYEQEKSQNIIKSNSIEIKKSFTATLFKGIRNVLISLFGIFPLSILSICFSAITLVMVWHIFAILFSQYSLQMKLLLSFSTIIGVLFIFSSLLLLVKAVMKLTRVVKNNCIQVIVQKWIIITFISSLLLGVGISYFTSLELSKKTKNYSYKFDKEFSSEDLLQVSLVNSNISISKGNSNSIEYRGSKDITFKNNNIEEKEVPIFSSMFFLVNPKSRGNSALKITVKDNIKTIISGIDNNVSINNVNGSIISDGVGNDLNIKKSELKKLDIKGVTSKCKVSNSKVIKFNISGVNDDIVLINSQLNSINLSGVDIEVRKDKDSKINAIQQGGVDVKIKDLYNTEVP